VGIDLAVDPCDNNRVFPDQARQADGYGIPPQLEWNMKKKPWKPVITLLVIILGLIVVLLVARQPWLTENPVYSFLNRMLKPSAGTDSLTAGQKSNTLPYALTDGQRYYKELVPVGAVNVLFIGPDVSGANYDSLLIASMDPSDGQIRLVNLPRDLYVEYGKPVLDALAKMSPKTLGSTPARKINAAHIIGKRIGYRKDDSRFGSPDYDFIADLIQEVFNIRIADVVLVKPSSFRKIVDYFGGVDILVPYRMNYSDPTQDLVIDLEKGFQHLNGSQAEGFVRFRQGYDENGKFASAGDFKRKANQVEFFKAFSAQHLTAGNLGKMAQIAGNLDTYLETSIVGADRVSAYAKLGASLLKNGLRQSSEEVACVNFKKNGIYFLRLATERESAEASDLAE
jgi:polyisoprenyl-teichoic acid--peptidoglycan teichoic acid transferase